ncbi:uncharacterized protein BJ171DRAFT_423639 [Polychytrium aggregatum]|uniref:uncharacterized protein n=1 Tax=Polychytrium aggregatum TaxID=110093 RepID=UPI0022FE67B0|nr:uncharacterized protein BJ171DRAFT_423639 [Polychytrium aggregatum]KAI9205141.1 hypothetical protein BJ171DRAFT_423639 [Polychytrium aggregatum]
MARLDIDDHNPDIFTIICFNDSFQLALDLTTIATLLRVCKQARPLLSSKVPRFHTWCQNAGLCNPDGQLRFALTPSDQIALSLHCEDQATADRSWLEDRAEQGNASASYFLARILQVDQESENDDELEGSAERQHIFRLLEKAANTSHPMAQFHLAGCYRNGLGVDPDHTKAIQLYRSLADRGIPQAQVALGRCYESGEGVDQDYDTAIEWYSKAADQGSEDGRLHILHLEAVCVFHGFGTTRDLEKAAGTFEQLADEGHSDSQFWIGDCYCYGGGVSTDYTKAFEWFRKSAGQDNSYGQWMVGFCYYNGWGVTKDRTKAVEWYRKSAGQDNRYGQDWLGECYWLGRGVPKNVGTAVFWYRKAAEQGFQDSIDSLEQLGKWP